MPENLKLHNSESEFNLEVKVREIQNLRWCFNFFKFIIDKQLKLHKK